jgi:hypothetical protein
MASPISGPAGLFQLQEEPPLQTRCRSSGVRSTVDRRHNLMLPDLESTVGSRRKAREHGIMLGSGVAVFGRKWDQSDVAPQFYPQLIHRSAC